MGRNEFLVLGAGPAGLAAAYELSRADKTVIVVEKDSQVGGLSKTLQFGQFKTDIGPHVFYGGGKEIHGFIKNLLGAHWVGIEQKSSIYRNGRLFAYPGIGIKNTVVNLGLLVMVKIFLSYLSEKVKNASRKKQPHSFRE